MNRKRRALGWLFLLAVMALLPQSVEACSVCFGKSDAPMAQGMNAGILTLLGVVVLLWIGVGSFFICLVRRANRMAHSAEPISTVSANSLSRDT